MSNSPAFRARDPRAASKDSCAERIPSPLETCEENERGCTRSPWPASPSSICYPNRASARSLGVECAWEGEIPAALVVLHLRREATCVTPGMTLADYLTPS